MNYAAVVSIRKLLKKSNYTIDVVAAKDGSGCVAQFPQRVISPIMPAAQILYTRSSTSINRAELMPDDSVVENTWDVNPVTDRLSILCDVVRLSQAYKYNLALIRYVIGGTNGKRHDSIFDILPLDADSEQLEKESVLIFLLSELKFGEDLKNFVEVKETAIKYSIEEDLNFLLNRFLI